jgi:hypothetical protein
MSVWTRRAVLIGVAFSAAPLFSQQPADAKPAFDVASVKPSPPGSRQQLSIQPGGRLPDVRRGGMDEGRSLEHRN